MSKKSRCIVYIDGFNLYFGLKRRKWDKYKWIDLYKFCLALLPDNADLVRIKYYTAQITKDQEKTRRQMTFINANKAHPKIDVVWGNYLARNKKCKHCHKQMESFEEKKSDVNMAIGIVSDAYEDKYDIAIVVTTDTDLVPAVQFVATHTNKACHVCFMSKRPVGDLKRSATKASHISLKMIKASQLDDLYIAPNGTKYKKPDLWM